MAAIKIPSLTESPILRVKDSPGALVATITMAAKPTPMEQAVFFIIAW
jgi:hypothetical protein